MTTMRQILSRYKRRYLQSRVVADQRRRVDFAFIHIPKCGGTSITEAIGQRTKLHDTAQVRRQKLGFERWNQLYTFSITRHPYERLISFYAFTKQTIYSERRIGDMELNDWVRAALRDRVFGGHIPDFQLAPCHDWLTDETGQIIVNDIFALETLSENWPSIRRRTGVVRDLPHTNYSRSSMTADLLDAPARKIIQRHFNADFEAFDYIP